MTLARRIDTLFAARHPRSHGRLDAGGEVGNAFKSLDTARTTLGV